jgi:hypothetical protein
MVLRSWLTDVFRPRLCLLTGSPGVGKSHLLAWLVATDLGADRSINAAMSARGMSADAFTWALGEQLSLPGESPAVLLAALAADTRRAVVAVGELDQSGLAGDGSAARRIIAEVLNPLLELQHVRLLVEGRPDLVGGFDVPAEVLNLDDPRLTDQAAFTAWVQETAARRGLAEPARVAAAVYPNAGLAEPALVAGPTRDGLAQDIAQRWIDGVPAQARPALEALGFAHEPVDVTAWHSLCTALVGDAERARESINAAGPIVVRPDRRYALSCRPLREAARRRLPQTAQIEYGIGYALHTGLPQPNGRADWAAAPAYTRTHLARHAAAAGVLGRLLADPGFLVHADPLAVSASFDALGDETPIRLRKVWRFAGPALVATDNPAERAALLRLAALHHRDDEVARWFGPYEEAAPWTARWVDARPATPGAGRWSGPAVALTYGSGPRDGQLVIATAGGRLHTVSPAGGENVGRIAGDPLAVHGLVAFGDGAVMTLDRHGVLRLTRPLTVGSRADRLNTLLNMTPVASVDSKAVIAAVRAYACAPRSALGANRDVSMLAVGERTGAVQVWRLNGGPPTVAGQALHEGPVTAVTLLSPDGQRTLSVSGGADGAVRLWHPGTDRPGEPLGRRGVPVTAVAGGRLSTGPAVAAAWPDGLISLWDLSTGDQATIRLGFPVYALALGDDDTLVLGSEHGTTALRLTPRG